MTEAAEPFAGLPDGVAVLLRGYRPALASGRHGDADRAAGRGGRTAFEVDAGSLLGHCPACPLPTANRRHIADAFPLQSLGRLVVSSTAGGNALNSGCLWQLVPFDEPGRGDPAQEAVLRGLGAHGEGEDA